MNPEVVARWEERRSAILAAVEGADHVTTRIPGWEPGDLDQALWWVRVNIYEGFYVGHLVEQDELGTTLWLKNWEFGDDEPDWPSVKASPIVPTPPNMDIW
jgi:hypothetical protein